MGSTSLLYTQPRTQASGRLADSGENKSQRERLASPYFPICRPSKHADESACGQSATPLYAPLWNSEASHIEGVDAVSACSSNRGKSFVASWMGMIDKGCPARCPSLATPDL